MTPTSVKLAIEAAEEFLLIAQFVEAHYDTYRDGAGFEHYVQGPGCAQLRNAAHNLALHGYNVKGERAKALPAFSDDNSAEYFENSKGDR